MSERRVAVFSMHTSPLAQPGAGDGGGMNVYVVALASALAQAGVECDVYTRAEHPGQPDIVEVEPGFRVLHIEAGPCAPVAKHELIDLVDPFVEASRPRAIVLPVDVLHANYWLSGAVAHRLKHELDLPLAATFHTLARVKADAGVEDDPALRARIEHEVIACADMMFASTVDERVQLASLYDADPDRIEIVAPGVDHALFAPGDRTSARERLGIAGERVLLFVGRIQPLKGLPLAVRVLAELEDPDVTLVVVGGPSGADGEAELAKTRALAEELGVDERVQFFPAQPHADLAGFYRAADVCIVPSRTESFGLVALEAAACGTPVVAAAVGGLRSLVDDGGTGFLVDGRDPVDYAVTIGALFDDERLAAEMSIASVARSQRYSWSSTAGRLRRSYGDLAGARARALRLTVVRRRAMDSRVDTALDEAFLAAKHTMIAEHLEGEVAREPWVQTVEYDASIPRWYVRFGCEGRDAATIYFDLHQRTLRYELYFMPDPPKNHEALYRFLLQCSHAMYGAHFSIGPDGDCYLVGRTLLEHLDVAELDRIIGVLYAAVERWFQAAIRIGFGPR